ncbi:MAG: GntR family transcriptional regulator [Oscillospiraceae bacterium]|nr:GntR family transcriptional regulator [Oscillospiraceae bacterium]
MVLTVQLDYRDARPIYTQIVDNFRNQVKAGILQTGDKLPSVRELATALTINPNTIQRAYRELEMEGWIASVPGKGSFVCGVPGGAQPEQLALLESFDKTVAALQKLGMTTQELMARLQQGGNENA